MASRCDNTDVADMLVQKIFCWVDLQKECANKLKKLSNELEETKKDVNVSKVVGSSVSVGGAVALTAAGVLGFFTGGLAIPVLVAAGSVATAAGVTTNVVSDVVDVVSSSSTMKDAEKVGEKIENLENIIQKDMKRLRKEGERREKEARSCRDVPPGDYVVEKILRALAKRSGLELHEGVSLLNLMTGLSKISGEDIALHILTGSGVNVLSKFVLKAIAKQSGKALMRELFPELVLTMGRAATKAAGRVAGGAVGLVFSVPELIINCKNLDNCTTEQSQALRRNANAIRSAAEELKKELDAIEAAFQRLAGVKLCIEKRKRSAAERKTLVKFALEICQNESVVQCLSKNSECELFFKLVDMFYLLKEKLVEEEKKNHSKEVDISFLAHGSITEVMIPASCLLPLAPVTDVLLYSPWNCYLCADAAYCIATGLMKPEDRDFCCSGRNCKIPAGKHRPTNLPNSWNSLKKAGDKRIPNIMLSPVGKPGDGAWESFEFLTNIHGKPGRNHIIVPYVLPGEKNSSSSDSIPFYIVTLALSLVLLFSRFQATIHLTACLGKMSPRLKLNEDYLEKQYAYAVNETCMRTSPSVLNRLQAQGVDVKLLRILKSMFG